MSKAAIYLVAFGLFVSLLSGAYYRGRAAGHVAGIEAQRKQTMAAEDQRDRAIAAARAMSNSLEATTRTAQVEVARARAQQDSAKSAADAALATAKEADRTLRAWMDRYAQASRDPTCHVLEETLCAAASDF